MAHKPRQIASVGFVRRGRVRLRTFYLRDTGRKIEQQGDLLLFFALCRANKRYAVVPDLDEQSPHRRFVAVCGPCFREQQKCSGLALLHFRLYQFYQMFVKRISRHAVALRVSDDDSAKFLRQPLFTERTVAEISVKVCDRQYYLVGIMRLLAI